MSERRPYRRLVAALLALAVAASSTPSHAKGVPVFDIVADIQRVFQVEEAIATTKHVADTLQKAREHYQAITGVRNLDDVMRLELVREAIPYDYRRLYRCARSRNYGCISDSVADIIEEHRIADVCLGIEDALRRDSCEERAVKGAIDHAIALDAMDSFAERNETIRRLAARIPSTTDPKELGELQARIDAEGLAMQNESLALDAARDASESYERILAQRDREIEDRTWRSRTTPDVAPLSFGG